MGGEGQDSQIMAEEGGHCGVMRRRLSSRKSSPALPSWGWDSSFVNPLLLSGTRLVGEPVSMSSPHLCPRYKYHRGKLSNGIFFLQLKPKSDRVVLSLF